MKVHLIHRYLEEKLTSCFSEDPSVIVREFELCQGVVRADVVVVNGHLHGYEIKSDDDTLDRLPQQIFIYNRVLDFATIVTGKKHLNKVKKMVPKWWGIWIADESGDSPEVTVFREGKQNNQVDKYALAQLLWKEEALLFLSDLGIEKGLRSKPRKALWQALAESIDYEALSDRVRTSIKQRRDWRVDAIRTPCDAQFPPVSMSLGCLT